ncbi:MAG: hypothetical protein JEZ09_05660 [Salinivirgaceae bacterium]|nr:hypothetical protein [Salinivirgaceae bacterium]
MKYIYISYLLIGIILFASCNQPNKPIEETDFIYLEGNVFKHKGNDFFPKMINYSTNIFMEDSSFIIAPFRDYEIPKIHEKHSISEIQNQILGHFKLIKEMGFNTIRLCTDSNFGIDIENNSIIFKSYIDDNKTKWFDAIEYSEKYFEALQLIFDISEELNIRIMLLIKAPMVPKAEVFTKLLLQKFKDSPVVFAYDFMNEPLYFDNSHLKNRSRDKKDAFKIVSRWKIMMDKYAPNQLFTIGFSEPIEVFEWDPSILPVDFVQFHTYHPLRIPSEMYWYANYVGKPWMIGETSLPADNDSVFYEEQRQFLVESYKKVIDLGGCGYGWWGFQEVRWGGFEHDYTSMLNLDGKTITKDSLHTIIGTIKPAGKVLQKLNYVKSKTNNEKPINYYNMLGYDNIKLCGKIINKKTGEPIEGAVIRGWTKWFKIGLNTFTDENGNFSLYSNDKLIYFCYSAPGMSCEKMELDTTYQQINGYKYSMDSLKNEKLEYHDISFVPFLMERIDKKTDKIESDNYIFNFKLNKFDNAKFEGTLGTLELEPLRLRKPGFIKRARI